MWPEANRVHTQNNNETLPFCFSNNGKTQLFPLCLQHHNCQLPLHSPSEHLSLQVAWKISAKKIEYSSYVYPLHLKVSWYWGPVSIAILANHEK
jgi:hypothetical protein